VRQIPCQGSDEGLDRRAGGQVGGRFWLSPASTHRGRRCSARTAGQCPAAAARIAPALMASGVVSRTGALAGLLGTVSGTASAGIVVSTLFRSPLQSAASSVPSWTSPVRIRSPAPRHTCHPASGRASSPYLRPVRGLLTFILRSLARRRTQPTLRSGHLRAIACQERQRWTGVCGRSGRNGAWWMKLWMKWGEVDRPERLGSGPRPSARERG
jgi:hypothetical protein